MALCPRCKSPWDPENENICLFCGLQTYKNTKPYFTGVPASQLQSSDEDSYFDLNKQLAKPTAIYPQYWRANERDEEQARIRRCSMLQYPVPQTGYLGEIINQLKDYSIKIFAPVNILDEEDINARKYFNLGRGKIFSSYQQVQNYLSQKIIDSENSDLNEGLIKYHFYDRLLFGELQANAWKAIQSPDAYFDTLSFEYLGVACAVIQHTK